MVAESKESELFSHQAFLSLLVLEPGVKRQAVVAATSIKVSAY